MKEMAPESCATEGGGGAEAGIGREVLQALAAKDFAYLETHIAQRGDEIFLAKLAKNCQNLDTTAIITWFFKRQDSRIMEDRFLSIALMNRHLFDRLDSVLREETGRLDAEHRVFLNCWSTEDFVLNIQHELRVFLIKSQVPQDEIDARAHSYVAGRLVQMTSRLNASRLLMPPILDSAIERFLVISKNFAALKMLAEYGYRAQFDEIRKVFEEYGILFSASVGDLRSVVEKINRHGYDKMTSLGQNLALRSFEEAWSFSHMEIVNFFFTNEEFRKRVKYEDIAGVIYDETRIRPYDDFAFFLAEKLTPYNSRILDDAITSHIIKSKNTDLLDRFLERSSLNHIYVRCFAETAIRSNVMEIVHALNSKSLISEEMWCELMLSAIQCDSVDSVGRIFEMHTFHKSAFKFFVFETSFGLDLAAGSAGIENWRSTEKLKTIDLMVKEEFQTLYADEEE
jgi:hypothetical protein